MARLRHLLLGMDYEQLVAEWLEVELSGEAPQQWIDTLHALAPWLPGIAG